MSRIYTPSPGPDAWRQFLAKPDLHWAKGYSARTLAHAWEAAAGLPQEVAAVIDGALGPCELLLALPEHKVPLPGGRRESQCDVFALVRSGQGLVSLAIEGKVDEPFGPTIGEWRTSETPGKRERLQAIQTLLGKDAPPDSLRYQLLHRTAAAVIEAHRFDAKAAAMVVHSFSPIARWRDDYVEFLKWLNAVDTEGAASTVSLPCGRVLVLGWAAGDPKYLAY